MLKNKKLYLLLSMAAPLIYLIFLINNIGWYEAFSNFYIVPMEPIFADSRSISGAINSINSGFDPYVENPFDPWKRSITYPPIWIEIYKFLNLNTELNFLVFIVLQIVIFLFILAKLLLKTNEFKFVLIIMSWSTFLIIERGNNDLTIFILVYLFLTFKKPFLKTITLFISVVLKFYTIPLIIFLKGKKYLFSCLFFIFLYLVISYEQIIKIRNSLEGITNIQYGLDVSLYYLKYIGLNYLNSEYLFIIFILTSIPFIYYLIRHENNYAISKNSYEMQPFLVGSSIYIFTFIFQNNFDYRLVFLFFCLPLVSKLSSRNKYFIFTNIFISCNLGFINYLVLLKIDFYLDIFQISKTITFIYLLLLNFEIFKNHKNSK